MHCHDRRNPLTSAAGPILTWFNTENYGNNLNGLTLFSGPNPSLHTHSFNCVHSVQKTSLILHFVSHMKQMNSHE